MQAQSKKFPPREETRVKPTQTVLADKQPCEKTVKRAFNTTSNIL